MPKERRFNRVLAFFLQQILVISLHPPTNTGYFIAHTFLIFSHTIGRGLHQLTKKILSVWTFCSKVWHIKQNSEHSCRFSILARLSQELGERLWGNTFSILFFVTTIPYNMFQFLSHNMCYKLQRNDFLSFSVVTLDLTSVVSTGK